MTIHVRKVTGPTFEGDADSADMRPGDVVYWKDADDQYALADASDKTKPAQFIVVSGGGTGQADYNDRVTVGKRCELFDDASGFTENSPQYLSETAGAYTETRPTTIGSLRQKVGEAITTSRMNFEIANTKEVEIPIIVTHEGVSAAVVIDSGNFASEGSTDAANETVYLVAMLPEGFLSVVAAGLWVATEAEVAAVTFELELSGALSDEAWDANTVETALNDQPWEGSAADDVFRADILAAFTSTLGLALSKPGSILGLKMNRDDSGTDIAVCFGGTITCEVVG